MGYSYVSGTHSHAFLYSKGMMIGLFTSIMWPTIAALLYVTFGCMLSIGFWARPLVSNALLRDRAEIRPS